MALQEALDLRTRQAEALLDAVEGLLDIIPLAVRGSVVDAAIAAVAIATGEPMPG